MTASPGRSRALLEAIYEANLTWMASVRANAGLMRCLLQLGDQVPEFKQLNEQLNHEWFAHVTQRLIDRFPGATVDDNAVLLAVYALGGMMDELMPQGAGGARGASAARCREDHANRRGLGRIPLGAVVYRALFGSEPRRVNYPASRALLALSQLNPLSS